MKINVFSQVVLHILLAAFCFSAMAADTGDLQVTCKPGIRIYLDDEFVGVTKSEEEGGLLLEGIRPGKHKVRGEKADFISQEFEVQIEAGKTKEIKIGRDGAPMVLIPAGEFQMGSSSGADDEKPVHTVYLDAFYMDVYEVTNAQYRKFMDATGHSAPVFWGYSDFNAPNQPVVGVSWHGAKNYCQWAGKRLPTEAEWEKAARGGLVGKKYPWGDSITHDNVNYDGTGGKDRWKYAAPVGSFAPNGYGLYDMAGNVWEWCADWYDRRYYANSPRRNPKGPNSGAYRILRGGGWGSYPVGLLVRGRYSVKPAHSHTYRGFRCVAVAQEGGLLLQGIKPGKHKVRGEKTDFISQEFEVQIEAGKTKEIKIGKDGAPMVLISAGEFQMGSSNGNNNESPVHTVYVDAFYMDVYEVTNAQYRKFVDATGHSASGYWSDSKYNAPNQPVVGVSWHDAKAYCQWAGKRLPTEAEWEKAARGGLVGKKYPWGDSITHDNANYGGTGGKDRWTCTAPVGSFAPNGYGLYDIAGNVWEWCADWYDNSYYANSSRRNPTGPSSGYHRVLRGGSWNYVAGYLRAACRYDDNPARSFNGGGFRGVVVAQD